MRKITHLRFQELCVTRDGKKQSLRDVQSSEGSTAQCSPVSAHDQGHSNCFICPRYHGVDKKGLNIKQEWIIIK